MIGVRSVAHASAAALLTVAGVLLVASCKSPGAAAVLCASALLAGELPLRNDRAVRLTLAPVPLAALAGVAGPLEGMAAGMLFLSAGVLLRGFPGNTGSGSARAVLSVIVPCLLAASQSAMHLGAGPGLSAAVAFVLLVAGSGMLDAIRGGRRAWAGSLLWIPAGVLMAPLLYLTWLGVSQAGTTGAALLSLPLFAFAGLSSWRRRSLDLYERKTSELAAQNALSAELASSKSTTEFLDTAGRYLSPGSRSFVVLLTRQAGGGSGWVGWSSAEQRASNAFPAQGGPPGWNEIRTGVRLQGRSGALIGLSPSRDMALFVDGGAATRLEAMEPDIRGNFVSLVNHAWQAVGHSLTIDSAFIAAAMILARLADSKDDYTHGHSIRVARLSYMLGARIGLSVQKLKTLRVGALLHDLGKVAVPAEILTKRGLLTREERTVIERHPVEGAEILGSLRGYDEVREIVGSHHERLDGKGYPSGLSGRGIPFLARVVAVADTFDAITSSRSYRADADRQTALEAIRAGSGTQFDSRVVAALEKMLEDGDETI